MISFEEARRRVLERVTPVRESERVAVEQARGRVTASVVLAPLDVPAHANSAMDGYGVRLADLFADSDAKLKVVATITAGMWRETPLAAGEAVRIMTGAPVPPGCEAVVMQEETTREGEHVFVPSRVKAGQNIRAAGEDIRRGSEALPAGRRLSAADLGVLASLGLTEVVVWRRPRVALLSTGDELTPPGQPLSPGSIYDSNRAALRGLVEALGAEVLDLGLVRDSHRDIAAALRRGAAEADVLLTSGGVSEGELDLVKTVIAELGVIEFWKVAMKPGKPQACGKLGDALYFGLPGNPVSSVAVFLLMVRPALIKLMGAAPEPDRSLHLPLRGTIRKRHERLDFQRGVVHFDRAGAWVESTGEQGSGIFTSLSRANAFIVLPEGPLTVQDGDLVEVWLIEHA
ncbi:MAG: molybdopterin molybdotransferase MoeA [Magnetococcales bacterium]|nr:molybdopterin molybdotransferase MoeA [Magnetococcales bacterium]